MGFKYALSRLWRYLGELQARWQTRSWEERESKHFRVRHLPQDREAAYLALKTAEAVYEQAVQLVGYRPQGKRLILICPDRESLGRQLGWEGKPAAMGVYWAGVIRILSPLDWGGETGEAVEGIFSREGPMAHEFIHLLVDEKAKVPYPRWFTEGLALYGEKKIQGFQLPCPGKREWYSLTQMDKQFDLLEEDLAYYQAYALMDFFIQKRGEEKLRLLLDKLAEGCSFSRAFLAAWGEDLDSFFQEFAGNYL